MCATEDGTPELQCKASVVLLSNLSWGYVFSVLSLLISICRVSVCKHCPAGSEGRGNALELVPSFHTIRLAQQAHLPATLPGHIAGCGFKMGTCFIVLR